MLAEELAKATDVRTALRPYERGRRWRAGAVAMVARRATAGARPDSRAAVAARRRFVSLVPASVAFHQLELITRGP